LRTLFIAYGKAKQRQNVLDYDDLLLYWAKMLDDKDLAAEIGGRFDHVLPMSRRMLKKAERRCSP
jgi:DNA helicase-2/ATP-dependent DNA helicase PcrA